MPMPVIHMRLTSPKPMTLHCRWRRSGATKMADADWPTAAQWLASGDTKSAQPDLVVLGVPFNESITPGSCDLAPEAIRQALERYSTFDPDLKTDLRSLPAADAGDLSPEELPQSAELIRSRAGSARVTV